MRRALRYNAWLLSFGMASVVVGQNEQPPATPPRTLVPPPPESMSLPETAAPPSATAAEQGGVLGSLLRMFQPRGPAPGQTVPGAPPTLPGPAIGDPTIPSPRLQAALQPNAIAAPGRAEVRALPQIQLKGRILSPSQPPRALVVVSSQGASTQPEGSVQMVTEGAVLSDGAREITVERIDANGVTIRIEPDALTRVLR